VPGTRALLKVGNVEGDELGSEKAPDLAAWRLM